MLMASRFLRRHSPMMSGPDVLELQTLLAVQGPDPGPLDGIFGPLTELALRRFQKCQNLQDDGLAGTDTWRALTRGYDYGADEEPVPDEEPVEGPVENTAALPKIHVHVDTRILTMIRGGTITAYPVAVGKTSTPSPVGEWKVVFKSMNPGGPFGTRWMRLSVPWGGYGIHGTNNPNSIGKAVSHGCIRLYNEDVEKLYNLTPIGTPVSITGTVRKIRTLKYGMRGEDVLQVEQMLFDLGYMSLSPNSFYGRATQRAVQAFQRDHKLARTGRVGRSTLKALQVAYDRTMDDINP